MIAIVENTPQRAIVEVFDDELDMHDFMDAYDLWDECLPVRISWDGLMYELYD